MAPREIPKASDLQAFNYAVAGHAGTLCDSEGVLFIKPCMQEEISFYEAARDGHPELADLMPLFMGTLMLNDATDARDIAEQLPGVADAIPEEVRETIAEFGHHHHQTAALPVVVPAPAAPAAVVDNETWVPRGSQSIETDRAVVLENATYGYTKANVLDVKLGRRLWADDAPMQKRRRMDEVSDQTTHAEYGFRIAGMRVYKGSDDPRDLDETGYRIYDKDFGRKEVSSKNVVDAFRRFIFNEAAGVDQDHGRAIAQAFKADLERAQRVLEKERTRMYSSSLLFVFEGDGEALRAAVEDANASASASEARRERTRGKRSTGPHLQVEADATDATSRSRSRREVLGKVTDRSSSRTDSGIVIDDDESDFNSGRSELELDEEYAEDEDDEDNDEDDDDDDDDEANMPHIYGLRLIDFAHAKFVPHEEGPDENNLLGIRSLIEIFDELAK